MPKLGSTFDRLTRMKAMLGRIVAGTARHGGYESVKLSGRAIDEGDYKHYLGGGPEAWNSRGAFQLHFLRAVGMQEGSKLIDVGCGPGRASSYLIDFLAPGAYCGVDYNPDFIKAATEMSVRTGLVAKQPSFKVVDGFDFDVLDHGFDFGMVFSVLNHCNSTERNAFFRHIPGPMTEGGKVYISHARWFNRSYILDETMKQSAEFGPDDFDITKFGWARRDEIFPIIELSKN